MMNPSAAKIIQPPADTPVLSAPIGGDAGRRRRHCRLAACHGNRSGKVGRRTDDSGHDRRDRARVDLAGRSAG